MFLAEIVITLNQNTIRPFFFLNFCGCIQILCHSIKNLLYCWYVGVLMQENEQISVAIEKYGRPGEAADKKGSFGEASAVAFWPFRFSGKSVGSHSSCSIRSIFFRHIYNFSLLMWRVPCSVCDSSIMWLCFRSRLFLSDADWRRKVTLLSNSCPGETGDCARC